MKINSYLFAGLFVISLLLLPANLISSIAGAQQSGQSHKITFENNCSSHSIWIAAYNGFGGDAPLLCETNSSGATATGTCSRDMKDGVPPPWASDGSPTWEIPANGTRSLTVPFCYTSADFGARTGCTQGGNELKCTGGDCGGLLNCGTGGKEPQPITLAEFTFDGGEGVGCNTLDNYDVSTVAGFNMRVTITPDKSECVVAGNQCKSLDGVCPYNEVLWNPTSNLWDVVTSSDTDIPTCLSPSNMAAFPGVPPFTGFSADEKARLGCNPAPYNISPVQPVGNCFATFGSGGACTLSACGLGPTFCDPYGQCDSELNRTAIWPSYTDPNTMTQTLSTIYIEKIQKACGNNTNGGGIYAWQFDDNNAPPGLSGGLYTCPSVGAQVQGINYTVKFWCDGDKDSDELENGIDNDSDNDGIPDSQESAETAGPSARVGEDPNDFDFDRLKNELDLDSDGDGIPDHFECNGGNDEDRDGLSDNFADADEDGHHDLHDESEGGELPECVDTDGDGNPDFLDHDSDDDGFTDAEEAEGVDENIDGIHDFIVDENADGLADSVHPDTGTPLTIPDTNGDGTPDFRDSGSQVSFSSNCSLAGAGASTGSALGYLLVPALLILRRVLNRFEKN